MANVTTLKTLVDGERNVVIHATGVLDTSDVASAVLVDVSALVPIPVTVRIDKVVFAVAAGLTVELLWDATADVLAFAAAGGGDHEIDYRDVGGLQNTLAAGYTGDINYLTTGWVGTLAYALTLYCTKQY